MWQGTEGTPELEKSSHTQKSFNMQTGEGSGFVHRWSFNQEELNSNTYKRDGRKTILFYYRQSLGISFIVFKMKV